MATSVRGQSEAWVVLSMAPAPPERVRGWFTGIGALDLRFPEDRTPDAVRAAIGAADIVLSDWSSALHVDRAAVEAASRLAFVMSPAVGLDSLDVPALTDAGVVVANTAGLNAPSVAEWCLGATFAVARSLTWVDREVRAGRLASARDPGARQHGARRPRVGVVGFGAVGSRVARAVRRASAATSRYWTRHPRSADETGTARPGPSSTSSSRCLMSSSSTSP